MDLQTLYRKAFLSNYFFTIAIRKGDGSIRRDLCFRPGYVMPADRDHWAADPMLVDDGDRTWLFYEAVDHDRGHIAVAEVFGDCTLGPSSVILKDDTHYSYPFVFRRGEQWYMIPESSQARAVRLYRAAEFPCRWEQTAVLLEERAVDTTVFEQNGRWYLLTFLTDGQTERVTPRAYRMDWCEESVQLTQLPWENYDTLRVRGAGPLIRDGDRLLRPAQVSTELRYGDAVAFYRVDCGGRYRETPEFEMTKKNITGCGIFADGLHTYSASRRFEAIDLRTAEFDLWKPAKKLISILRR